jgi:beta-propeller uncharacterized protein DUF5122
VFQVGSRLAAFVWLVARTVTMACGRACFAAWLAVFVVVCASATASPAAAAPSNGTSGKWTLIGGTQVSALGRLGDVVYMAGSFTGIARRTPGVAAFDTAGGAVASNLSDLDPGDARVVAAAPDGGVYVAGPFTSVGGISQPRLLRFRPDDKVDTTFRPQLDGEVDDIAVGADGTVYVAGGFTKASGQSRNGLAALDGATGAPRAWRPDLPAGARVRDVELGPGGAFVAGDFTTIGGLARPGLAQVSLADASPTPWNPKPNASVAALAVAGSSVFVAGTFTQVGGAARTRVAAVGASGTGTLLAGWDPQPNGTVTKLHAHGSTVYLSGSFTQAGGQARNWVAAVDAGTGAATAWNAGIATVDTPTAILATDDRVYLGFATPPGRKVNVAGQLRCGLAVVAADSGQIDAGWDPQLSDRSARCGGNFDGVRSLALAGGRLWAAGQFEVANVRPRAGLAALDVVADAPTDWAPVANLPNAAGISGVRDLALSPDGATVYLGGQFANVNGVPRLNAAAVPPAGPATRPEDVTAWDPAPNGRVNAIAVSASGARVYLGGEFTKLGTASVARLGWVSPWDAATTPGAASGWRPAPDAKVSDVALAADGSVFAAGTFNAIGQTAPAARRAVAQLSSATGDPTAWDVAAPATAEVDSVALAGGVVYLGGKFNGVVGGAPRSGVAALDQATAAATPWAADVSGGAGRVQQVGVAPDGTVYLVGSFTSVGGSPRSNAASVAADGTVTGWNPPGMPAGPSPPVPQFVGDRVVAGGAFTNAGGRIQALLAIFAPAVAPASASLPVVDAAALVVGAKLTCRPGSFSGSAPFTLAYEWLRDGAPILGETALVYTSRLDDVDRDLSCRELAYNAAGEATQTSAPVRIAPVAPTLEVPPAVGGEPWVGGVAQCSTGLWRNAPTGYSYRWLVDGAVVDGATAAGLALGAAELGHALACEVTASNSAGAGVATSAAVTVGVAPPRNLSTPLLAGEARVGAELGCDPGSWEGATGFAYAWLRDGVVIPGWTAARQRMTSRELGHAVACRVTASGPGGARSAESAALRVEARPRQGGSRVGEAGGGAAGRRAGVDLRQVRVRRDGTLALRVAAPDAGMVKVEATRVVRKRLHGTARDVRVIMGRAARRAARAGTISLTLRPSATARRALRAARRRGMKVQFVVTFRPDAGGRSTDRATLSLRPAAR